MRFTGTTVLKVENGLITEEVGLDDGVTVLRQLRPHHRGLSTLRIRHAVARPTVWPRHAAFAGIRRKPPARSGNDHIPAAAG